jgi:hypothetical protein
LLEFLEERAVDTSSLVSRTETLINNGVMVTDRGTINAQQVAAGTGAQAVGLLARMRGAEDGSSSAEGGS